MWLLECLKDASGGQENNEILWIVGYSLLVLLDIFLFLFGAVPVIRLRHHFAKMPRLHTTTRVCALITIVFEALRNFLSIIIGRSMPKNQTPWHIALGLTLLELPPYVIDTVYCLYIFCFLAPCFQEAPNRYVRSVRVARITFVAYNAVCYTLFVVSFVSEVAQWFLSSLTRAIVVGSLIVARDFGLCLVFVGFVLILRHHMGEDGFANPSPNELRVVWGSLVLSIIGLVRGSFTLLEAIAMRSEVNECRTGVYIWFLLNEIIVEGVPQAILLSLTNGDLQQFAAENGMHAALLTQSQTYGR
jgi:hypothetical protein